MMGAPGEAVEWRVPVGEEATTALYEAASGPAPGPLLVLAHGAGTDMRHRGMVALGETFRARGISTVRFNFLYKERGTGGPDRMPRLMECYTAVVEHARREVGPRLLLIGGHSMGGRTASMLGAEGFDCDGLVLLAYPLHPAGQPEKLRDEHLPRIARPTLCLNGTRDDLCRRDLMEAVLPRLPATFTMHWLEGADHGYHVQKRSGRTDADVMDEIGETTLAWLQGIRV